MAMYHIATWTATADTQEFTFSNIPQTFKHLQLRYVAKNPSTTGTDNSNLFDTTYIRFNGDTTTSAYADHFMNGNGTSVTVGSFVQVNSAIRSGVMPTSNASMNANVWGIGIIEILNYSNTNTAKTLRSFSGADNNGTGMMSIRTAVWNNTSAITSIFVGGSTQGYKTGSRYDLYGIVDPTLTGV